MIARTILIAIVAVCAWGSTVAQQSAPSDGERIGEAFRRLDGSTRWRLVRRFGMNFDTFHPQGMTKVGEKLYVSAVEVIDRRAGRGKAHLFEADLDGDLLRRIDLTDGTRYHPGGIDFDGEFLWVPVAEYKPDSSAVIYAVDPDTLSARRIVEIDDHLGGAVHDRDHNRLIANSWGSRTFYQWTTEREDGGIKVRNPEEPARLVNRAHYVSFQDGQWLNGTETMLCSGLRRYPAPVRGTASYPLGGMELLSTRTLEPLHQVPIVLWEGAQLPLTQNPTFVEAAGDGLRFYFMPADNTSTVHVFEPLLD